MSKATSKRAEEFKALPLSEKIQQNRVARVTALFNVGYITREEADKYDKPLEFLPTERKDLVVAYYLLGIEEMRGIASTMGEARKLKRIIDHLPSMDAEDEDQTADRDIDLQGTAREILTLQIKQKIRRAEVFVDAKRRRLLKYLRKILRFQLCLSLSLSTEETENIPYLLKYLKAKGYEHKGKTGSLSDKEKEAIEIAVDEYLALIELSFLSGKGLIREAEYKKLQDEEGNFKETYYYKDVYDEALLEFGIIYLILDNAVALFYENTTGKETSDFLKFCYSEMTGDLYKDTDILRGSKFAYILEEEEIC